MRYTLAVQLKSILRAICYTNFQHVKEGGLYCSIGENTKELTLAQTDRPKEIPNYLLA